MNLTSQISLFDVHGLTVIKMSFEKYFNLSFTYKNNKKKVFSMGCIVTKCYYLLHAIELVFAESLHTSGNTTCCFLMPGLKYVFF